MNEVKEELDDFKVKEEKQDPLSIEPTQFTGNLVIYEYQDNIRGISLYKLHSQYKPIRGIYFEVMLELKICRLLKM